MRDAVVNDLISDMRSPKGVKFMGEKCLTLIRTRWVYLVDAVHYILKWERLIHDLRGFP
jgi:hypothetical protein